MLSNESNFFLELQSTRNIRSLEAIFVGILDATPSDTSRINPPILYLEAVVAVKKSKISYSMGWRAATLGSDDPLLCLVQVYRRSEDYSSLYSSVVSWCSRRTHVYQ